MKYTLDLSGHDDEGNPGIDRFGGLFSSIEEAVSHGESEADRGRLAFTPEAIWVRDQEGVLVRKTAVV